MLGANNSYHAGFTAMQAFSGATPRIVGGFNDEAADKMEKYQTDRNHTDEVHSASASLNDNSSAMDLHNPSNHRRAPPVPISAFNEKHSSLMAQHCRASTSERMLRSVLGPLNLSTFVFAGAAVPILASGALVWAEMNNCSDSVGIRIILYCVVACGLAILATLFLALLVVRPVRRVVRVLKSIVNLSAASLTTIPWVAENPSSAMLEMEEMMTALGELGRSVQSLKLTNKASDGGDAVVSMPLEGPPPLPIPTEIMPIGAGGIDLPKPSGTTGNNSEAQRRQATVIVVTPSSNIDKILNTLTVREAAEWYQLFTSICLQAIQRNHGVVWSFGGGTVVATWNAAQPQPNHESWACWCALETRELLDTNPLLTRFAMRVNSSLTSNCQIAVAAAPAVIGTVTASETNNSTALFLSPIMNLCHRLVQLNPLLGTNILISQPVYEAVQERFFTIPIDYVRAEVEPPQPVSAFATSQTVPSGEAVGNGLLNIPMINPTPISPTVPPQPVGPVERVGVYELVTSLPSEEVFAINSDDKGLYKKGFLLYARGKWDKATMRLLLFLKHMAAPPACNNPVVRRYRIHGTRLIKLCWYHTHFPKLKDDGTDYSHYYRSDGWMELEKIAKGVIGNSLPKKWLNLFPSAQAARAPLTSLGASIGSSLRNSAEPLDKVGAGNGGENSGNDSGNTDGTMSSAGDQSDTASDSGMSDTSSLSSVGSLRSLLSDVEMVKERLQSSVGGPGGRNSVVQVGRLNASAPSRKNVKSPNHLGIDDITQSQMDALSPGRAPPQRDGPSYVPPPPGHPASHTLDLGENTTSLTSINSPVSPQDAAGRSDQPPRLSLHSPTRPHMHGLNSSHSAANPHSPVTGTLPSVPSGSGPDGGPINSGAWPPNYRRTGTSPNIPGQQGPLGSAPSRGRGMMRPNSRIPSPNNRLGASAVKRPSMGLTSLSNPTQSTINSEMTDLSRAESLVLPPDSPDKLTLPDGPLQLLPPPDPDRKSDDSHERGAAPGPVHHFEDSDEEKPNARTTPQQRKASEPRRASIATFENDDDSDEEPEEKPAATNNNVRPTPEQRKASVASQPRRASIATFENDDDDDDDDDPEEAEAQAQRSGSSSSTVTPSAAATPAKDDGKHPTVVTTPNVNLMPRGSVVSGAESVPGPLSTPHSAQETPKKLPDVITPSTQAASRERGASESSSSSATRAFTIPNIPSLAASTSSAMSNSSSVSNPAIPARPGPKKQRPSVTIKPPERTSGNVLAVPAPTQSRSPKSPQAPSTRPSVIHDTRGDLWRGSNTILGSGTAADVYLGMDSRGQLSAMKYLKVGQLKPREIEGVLQELSLLAECRHDNIVSYYAVAIIPPAPAPVTHIIIMMQYIACGSLQKVLETFGALEVSTVRSYARDVLRGLEYLHQRGIVHRDVKPANLLLDSDGHCKLADFGTAGLLQTRDAEGRLIGDTKLRGSPLYMAPECTTTGVCPASDIWSLGVSILELLCNDSCWGEHRYNEDKSLKNPYALAYHIAHCETAIPHIPDTLPPDVYTFVHDTLQRTPSLRPTASDILQEYDFFN